MDDADDGGGDTVVAEPNAAAAAAAGQRPKRHAPAVAKTWELWGMVLPHQRARRINAALAVVGAPPAAAVRPIEGALPSLDRALSVEEDAKEEAATKARRFYRSAEQLRAAEVKKRDNEVGDLLAAAVDFAATVDDVLALRTESALQCRAQVEACSLRLEERVQRLLRQALRAWGDALVRADATTDDAIARARAGADELAQAVAHADAGAVREALLQRARDAAVAGMRSGIAAVEADTEDAIAESFREHDGEQEAAAALLRESYDGLAALRRQLSVRDVDAAAAVQDFLEASEKADKATGRAVDAAVQRLNLETMLRLVADAAARVGDEGGCDFGDSDGEE